MFTTTGTLSLAYVAPYAVLDATAPDGVREEQQITLVLRSASDEKEYQFNLPIGDKTVGIKQLEDWQGEGKTVTVFASSLRALPFIHDTAKDQDGNPLKKYQRAGRKVKVSDGLTIETDAFVVFSAYDVRLAAQADLAQEAQKAHGEFAKRQAEYRKRSVQARIEKAKLLVEERRAQIRAQARAGAAAAAGQGGASVGNAKKTA